MNVSLFLVCVCLVESDAQPSDYWLATPLFAALRLTLKRCFTVGLQSKINPLKWLYTITGLD